MKMVIIIWLDLTLLIFETIVISSLSKLILSSMSDYLLLEEEVTIVTRTASMKDYKQIIQLGSAILQFLIVSTYLSVRYCIYFNISNAKMFLRKICTGKSIRPSSETLQLVFVHGISFLLLCGYQEYIIKEWKYYSFDNYNLNDSDLDTISKNKVNNSIVKNDDYILLHFDEKWIHNDYIKNYKSIEPDNYLDFENFIKNIVTQSENNLYITTGLISNKFTNLIKSKFNKINEFKFELNYNNKKIIFFEKTTFTELEILVSKSSILISCHGAATHVAAAFNIKIIDILDKSKILFYKKWTTHLRNYKKVERDNFKLLSNKIINVL